MDVNRISDTMKIFSDRLSDLLSSAKEKGDDLRSISKKIGISKSTLSDYANTKREPRITELAKIAEYFNVSTDYLLGLSDVRSRDITIREIAQFTGLTEESVDILHKSNEIIHKRLIPDNIALQIDSIIGDRDDLIQECQDYILKQNFEQHEIGYLLDNSDEITDLFIEEQRKHYLDEIRFNEFSRIEAANYLIMHEHKYHILQRISMYLFSYTCNADGIYFTSESQDGNGCSYLFQADILIAGILAQIDEGLQKMRETSKKKYRIRDFKPDARNYINKDKGNDCEVVVENGNNQAD